MIQFIRKNQHATIVYGLLLTAALFLCFTIGSKVFTKLTVQSLSMETRFVVTRLAFWLCFAVIYWYVLSKEKQSFLLWTEKRYSIGFSILSIFAILLVILIGAIIIALPIKLWGTLKISNAMLLMLKLSFPAKLFGVFTAGLLEELIFRGYLIPRLQLFFKNQHLPIIISAVLFGLLHVGYGTIVNVLIPIWIGLVFGYHYYKYRNLKMLIICHILIDYNALIGFFHIKH
jgi:membrane protease YdiL (CAAX protease family)